jgi:hypothetical protein
MTVGDVAQLASDICTPRGRQKVDTPGPSSERLMCKRGRFFDSETPWKRIKREEPDCYRSGN